MSKKKIWIDIDNSPHVPFFMPITAELEQRGCETVITARDAYQVSELVDFYGMKCHKIGRHFGRNKILKVLGVCVRALRLVPSVAACAIVNIPEDGPATFPGFSGVISRRWVSGNEQDSRGVITIGAG